MPKIKLDLPKPCNPCPFCGGVPEGVACAYGDYIRCKRCGSHGPKLGLEAATALWNRSKPYDGPKAAQTEFDKKLKPCKKCGGAAIYRHVMSKLDPTNIEESYVECLGCASTVTGKVGTRTDPVPRWENRERNRDEFFDCIVPGCVFRSREQNTQCGIHTKEEMNDLVSFSDDSADTDAGSDEHQE